MMTLRHLLPALLGLCLAVSASASDNDDEAHAANQRHGRVVTLAAGVGGDHVLVHRGRLVLSTGATLTQTSLRGTGAEVLASGFVYAACKAIDRHGNLFVVDFGANQVVRQRPDGTQAVIASGLLGPVGCALDSRQRLYVAEAGLGNLPGTRILRTNAHGMLVPWVDLMGSAAPLIALSGLAVDENDRLYVANYVDGRIARVRPDGRVSLFADVGIAPALGAFALSYLAFSGDELYATHLSGNRVWRITPAGVASVAAGTGASGSSDGPAATATFNLPNGVAALPGERGVYITEAGSGSLRALLAPR